MSDGQSIVLETEVPLSESVIWRQQGEFYVQRGMKAWTEDRIPQFITNNPFIAEIYVRNVSNFLVDCADVSAANPLRIFELGAGVGKFSYLFLRHLTAWLRSKGIAAESVRYCMTDCSEGLIEEWRGNRYLAEFVSSGMLEFERFNVGEETGSQFLSRGKGPLVVIANYVFDSLPQDAFEIKGGEMLEMLVSTARSAESGHGRGTLSDLKHSYKSVSVRRERYADPTWNEVLDLYRSRLAGGTLPFPCAALETLRSLRRFSDGRMLVLAADKGFAHEEELVVCQGPPAMEFHGNSCFSQMVNFDAIGKYVQAAGGLALLPEKHSTNLNICAFLFGPGRDEERFAGTRSAYVEVQAAFGPDDLFTLFAWLNAHMEEMTVAQILAALRLTRWDPIALLRLFPVLGRQLRTVVMERHDLRNAMMATWGNHYPVEQSENALAFDCGVILLELHFFEDAFSMFKISQQVLGSSAATSYNLGLCAAGLGRTSEALAFMTDACNLDAQFEPAKTMRRKLEEQNVGP